MRFTVYHITYYYLLPTLLSDYVVKKFLHIGPRPSSQSRYAPVRKRFETLQEKREKNTPNGEYENFVNAHFEAAAKCIPTKLKTKYRVPWETLAVREKRVRVKTASKNYRKNPTNTNALKLKMAQYQLAGIYIYIYKGTDRIHSNSDR